MVATENFCFLGKGEGVGEEGEGGDTSYGSGGCS